jgi:hypothetical protein
VVILGALVVGAILLVVLVLPQQAIGYARRL